MPKKPHGHYCRICEQYKANEKFSGRGHAAYICKACAKRGNKPPDFEPETAVYIDVGGIGAALSKEEVDLYPFPVDVDDVPAKPKRKRKPNKAKRLRSAQKKAAKALLSEILANDDVKVSEIQKAAHQAGIPHEALRRAKGSLKIVSAVTENGSVWRLPNKENDT